MSTFLWVYVITVASTMLAILFGVLRKRFKMLGFLAVLLGACGCIGTLYLWALLNYGIFG